MPFFCGSSRFMVGAQSTRSLSVSDDSPGMVKSKGNTIAKANNVLYTGRHAAVALLGEFDCTGLADDIHFDGSGVLHGRLNLGGDVASQLNCG